MSSVSSIPSDPGRAAATAWCCPTSSGARSSNEPIIVHGDGTQTRSFTWVGDVVSALIGLVETRSTCGEVFNIGNGAEISIRDLAAKVKSKTGSRSPIEYVPYSQVFDDSFEDMPRRVPDIGKIARAIGYRPTVHLDEIIEQVIDFWADSSSPNAVRRVVPIESDYHQVPAIAV